VRRLLRRLARMVGLVEEESDLRAYVVGFAGSASKVAMLLREELKLQGINASCKWAEPVSDYEVMGLLSSWCSDATCLGVFLDRPWKVLGPYIVDSLDESVTDVDSIDVVVLREGMLRGVNVERRVSEAIAKGLEPTTATVISGVEGLVHASALCRLGFKLRYVVIPEADRNYIEYKLKRLCSCATICEYDEEGLAQALGQADIVVIAGRRLAEDKLVAAALEVLVPRILVDATCIEGSIASRRLIGKTKVICCNEYYRMLVREAVNVMVKAWW